MTREYQEQKGESSYLKGLKEFQFGVMGIEKMVVNEKVEDDMYKGAIRRWLKLLHIAKESMAEISGKYDMDSNVGDFLTKEFGGKELIMTQSIVNTLCTIAPEDWLEEIGEDLGLYLYKTDNPLLEQYTENEVPYAEMRLNDKEYTLQFVEVIINEG